MNEKMPKLSHFCGVCQDEINERLGYKVYSCELCLIRIHAICMFPNASEMKLKVLYEFNTCFDVKCPECKANYKENMTSSLATKKDMKELIKSIEKRNQKDRTMITAITEKLNKSIPDMSNKRLQRNDSSNKLEQKSFSKVDKHVVIVENSEGSFSEDSWATVVKIRLQII